MNERSENSNPQTVPWDYVWPFSLLRSGCIFNPENQRDGSVAEYMGIFQYLSPIISIHLDLFLHPFPQTSYIVYRSSTFTTSFLLHTSCQVQMLWFNHWWQVKGLCFSSSLQLKGSRAHMSLICFYSFLVALFVFHILFWRSPSCQLDCWEQCGK